MRKRADEVQVSKRPRMAAMWPAWDAITAMNQMKFGPGTLDEDEFIMRDRAFADPERLSELVLTTEAGSVQMSSLAKQWERRQANAVQLLWQQLEALKIQRMEAEMKYKLLVEGHWGRGMNGFTYPARQEPVESTSPMDEDELSSCGGLSSVGSINSPPLDDCENSLEYWRERAKNLQRLLAESLQREQVLLTRVEEVGVRPDMSGQPEELKENLHRVDNFLHLALWRAPVVIAHQDADLRYRFIFNPYPGLAEDAILGKTDSDILQGPGVEECMEFKREVMKWGRPLQREIRFQTDLIEERTFCISAEPVFSKSGETIGLNYVAVDVTEEAATRERLTLIREEAAVQKAMETELHRSLVVTEEAMRAKQMLATMSHEIRSPLSGVVSMAQVLARTKLDPEQQSMVELMNSSGDHVLELINDILDLSKAESGAMKLEAKKFRPKQVVKHVLQLANASDPNKKLSLRGTVEDDVPAEVVGDVLRIRQVLTNLVSNAIKFTHQGSVEINVRMASAPVVSELTKSDIQESLPPVTTVILSPMKLIPALCQCAQEDDGSPKSAPVNCSDDLDSECSEVSRSVSLASTLSTLTTASSTTLSTSSSISTKSLDEVKVEDDSGPLSAFASGVWDLSPKSYELSEEIWVRCEVRDTGIGIPDGALPSLFEQYTQASTTTARKYGGTGLGLAICKQLVGLMGGTLEVKSKLHVGSSFSFTLPLRTVKEKISQETVASEGSPSRPPIKVSKGTDGKLRQLLRDSKRSWINALGEIPAGGNSKSSAEKSIPKLVVEEIGPDSRTSDVTASSSLKSSSVDPVDVQNFGIGISKPVLASTSCLSAKANLPRKGQSGSKVWSTLQSALKGSGSGPQVEHKHRRLPRILLAEDNKVNVVVAQSMMKRLGHALEVVSNGAEAVSAVQRNNYDLVLMDVSMPIMDGLEATRLIRKFEETGEWQYGESQSTTDTSSSSSITTCDVVPPDQHSEVTRMSRPTARQKTPIIAMTANAMADNVAECYNNGMDSFIAKPVTFEKLEQVLRQYLPWLECHRVQTS